jgi:hypothetical protein
MHNRTSEPVRHVEAAGLLSKRLFAATLSILLVALLAGCHASEFARANELNRCSTLTDAEVEEIIGRHDGGRSEATNEWGFQSCRWTSVDAQAIEGFPRGWFDSVEVAVFDKDREDWAREQARGEHMPDFKQSAMFDDSTGDLWFDCGAGRFCVVKVRTASSEMRKERAERLARLIDARVQ